MLAGRMTQKATTGGGEFEIKLLCLRGYPNKLMRNMARFALFVERERPQKEKYLSVACLRSGADCDAGGYDVAELELVLGRSLESGAKV